MIREISDTIRLALQNSGKLPYIEVFSGLVQTVTYKSQDQNSNPLTKKMPVSYDNNMTDCGLGKERVLTPDSTKKGILYIEDNGGITFIRELSGGRNLERANLNVVLWLNRDKFTDDKYKMISSQVKNDVVSVLSNINKTTSIILGININNIKQDNSIFSRYTYDEETTQYLRPPFEYMNFNILVNYINKDCTPIEIIETTC